MSKPSSPFDDDYVEPQHPVLAKRARRPWWRWNILTLFSVLFLMVWMRYLLSLSPGMTWAWVLTIFFLWGCAPMLVVPTGLTTLAATSTEKAGRGPSTWWRHNWLLIVLSWVARLLLLFSVLHLVFELGWLLLNSTQLVGYGRFRLSYLTMLYLPLIETFCCGVLYVLCEIAFRLDRSPSE